MSTENPARHLKRAGQDQRGLSCNAVAYVCEPAISRTPNLWYIAVWSLFNLEIAKPRLDHKNVDQGYFLE